MTNITPHPKPHPTPHPRDFSLHQRSGRTSKEKHDQNNNNHNIYTTIRNYRRVAVVAEFLLETLCREQEEGGGGDQGSWSQASKHVEKCEEGNRSSGTNGFCIILKVQKKERNLTGMSADWGRLEIQININ